jgi:vacuolar protein sorting-associated protein 41
MMFLLGKMGDNRKALSLIIERLGEVEMAIDFAKEQNDDSLWEEFLKYAMDKPPFIVGLLKNLSAHIDPLRVIERIPNGLDIPGLKSALVQIMSDCTVQLSLRNGCERILKSDTWNTLMQLIQTQRKGLLMSPDSLCSICGEGFDSENPREHIVIFACRHFFHARCVDLQISYDDVGDSSLDLLSIQERQITSVYSQKEYSISNFIKPQPLWIQSKRIRCPLCEGAK